MSCDPGTLRDVVKPIPKGHKLMSADFLVVQRTFGQNYNKISIRHPVGILKQYWILEIDDCIRRDYLYWWAFLQPVAFIILPARIKVISSPKIPIAVGAAQERTDEVLRADEGKFFEATEIETAVITVAGFSFNGRGKNSPLWVREAQRLEQNEKGPNTLFQGQTLPGQRGEISAIKDAIDFSDSNPPRLRSWVIQPASICN